VIEWRDSLAEVTPDEAWSLWGSGGVLVIERPEWTFDFGVLRAAMEPVEYKRKPLGPWQTGPMTEAVRAELQRAFVDFVGIFSALYGHVGPPAQSQFSWRPTITKGELHMDKGTPDRGKGEQRIVTGFVNVDELSRQWMVGEVGVDWPPECLWIFRAEKVAHRVVYGRACIQYNWVLM